MSDAFLTPATRRLLRRLQIFFFVMGILFLIVGLARILVEFFAFARELLADAAIPGAISDASFVLGIVLALVGYGSLYVMAAVGAREPPAMPALRNGLIAITLMVWSLAIWSATLQMQYLLGTLPIALLTTWITFRFWRSARANSLWMVFGERIGRRRRRRIWWVMLAVLLLVLISLGVMEAILTDVIELPLPDAEPGELLYATTFDDFNDEWDFSAGRQSSEVQNGELILIENSGIPEAGFYTYLEARKFRDFDLRVRARQIGGSDDNSYGVLFRWKDTENYYIFEISGDGYYRLTRVVDGVAENITPWTESEIVRQGNAANEIRIVGRDDAFTFHVNQQLALLCTKGENRIPIINPLTGECERSEWQTTFQDDVLRQGRIGFSVGTTRNTDLSEPITVGFDNLVVMGPESLFPYGDEADEQ